MIVCAGNNETFPFATAVGVGLIDSAINLTKLVQMHSPASLIFIGSAGSYGKYAPFDILESSSAANIEHAAITNSAYTPIKNTISLYHDNVSRETSPIVNCSNYITTDATIASLLLNKQCDLENMEFYSILKVAKSFGIPAFGIFVVTNYCHQDAHQEFLKNHQTAKDQLTKYIQNNYKEKMQ